MKSGGRLKLAPRADLGVFYDADVARYLDRGTRQMPELVTRERFIEFYADCPTIGFELDGRPIGGIVFDGEQAHIAVLPAYHGHWALLFKPALQWLFSLKDEILVEVERDNATCLRFLDRHGWERVGETDEDVLYRLVPLAGTRKTAYPYAGVRSRAVKKLLAAV